MSRGRKDEMSRAMDRAVTWLDERGGSGVLDRFNHMVAGGEIAERILCETWLRCVWSGRLTVVFENGAASGRVYTPAALGGLRRVG